MNVSVSVVDGKTVTSVHELVRNAAGKPVRIKAIEGGKYLLAEGEQGFAPENITLKRVGKNLHVALEGTDPDQPELIIEDFYEHEGQLVGMAEDSSYHEYVAVDGDDDSAVAFLIDGATSAQALGAAELVGFGDGLAMLAGSVIPTAALGLGALGIIGAGLAIGGKDGGSNSGGTQVAPPPAQPEIGQITDNVGDKQGVIQPAPPPTTTPRPSAAPASRARRSRSSTTARSSAERSSTGTATGPSPPSSRCPTAAT
nr:hypothetical protein [Pseudomonas citronellolis]